MMLSNAAFRRFRAAPSVPRDRRVDLILFVFMALVFGPVIGLHIGFAMLRSSPAHAAPQNTGTTEATAGVVVVAPND